jgi:carboxy-cis,cis-muconate cyclase
MPFESGQIATLISLTLISSFKHDKKSIYGSSMSNGRIVSYSTNTLESTGVTETSGACEGQNSAFNIASNSDPRFLFSCSYTYGEGNACGMSIHVKDDGSLGKAAHAWSYGKPGVTSSSHGFALSEVNGTMMLYTVDLASDSIWTHAIDKNGISKEVANTKLRGPGLKPRHMKMHPNGRYAYVSLEAVNRVTSLKVDEAGMLREDAGSHSLLPEGTSIHVEGVLVRPSQLTGAEADQSNAAQYWSAAVNISPNGRYLWATTRGRTPRSGFISCFLLDGEGGIVKRMFVVPTGTTNTTSSSLTVAPWSDEYVAFADAPGGYVAILKLEGGNSTGGGMEYASARVAAKLEIEAGECCGNPVWID